MPVRFGTAEQLIARKLKEAGRINELEALNFIKTEYISFQNRFY